MRVDSSILLFVAASALAAHIACGSSPATPGAPVPPTAAPTPPPTPTPDPGIPPQGSGCGEPYPPELARINVKLHIKAPEYFTLDSTPLVGPSPEFCREIGYTDGRQFCPVRLEQDPERNACEAWVMGNAEDTGKPGPTWMRESGDVLHDLCGERLRAQPRQSVLALHPHGRVVPGVPG